MSNNNVEEEEGNVEEAVEEERGNADEDETPVLSGRNNYMSSIQLEDLLKKKKFTEFRNKLNLPANLDETEDVCVLANLGKGPLNSAGVKTKLRARKLICWLDMPETVV